MHIKLPKFFFFFFLSISFFSSLELSNFVAENASTNQKHSKLKQKPTHISLLVHIVICILKGRWSVSLDVCSTRKKKKYINKQPENSK